MSFVDTNVLVYATFVSAPGYAKASAALAGLEASNRVVISRQVLREYLSAVTRPQAWASPMPLLQALQGVREYLRRFDLIEDGPPVWAEFERLSGVALFGGRQVHDANIVATMLAHGERRLLTFNAQHFRRFGSMIEVIEP